MKFVVAGALGHIGSLLVRKLGYWYPNSEVIMIDNLSAERYCSLFKLPKTTKHIFINGDVCELNLHDIFSKADVVFQLAAITNAEASVNNASEVEKNNYNATKMIALACKDLLAPMIYVSSTSVYGTTSNKVDENCGKDDLNPQSPYAKTKLQEEELLSSLAINHGLKMIILRFGTIFGTSPGMRFHTAVNKFCFQASIGEPLTVWRTAYDQMRPYLYLDDAMNAFKLIIDKSKFNNEIYNVLSGNYSVRNIVDAIKVHYPNLEIKFVDSKIMNQLSYEVLFDKFQAFGFTPTREINKGIKETLELINING